MTDNPPNPIPDLVMESEHETMVAVRAETLVAMRTELQDVRDYSSVLRAEAQSALIELGYRVWQLHEVRKVLNLARDATHPQVLSCIGQLKDRLRAQKRRARQAAMAKMA